MKQEMKKPLNEQQRIVAYLDSFPLTRDLRQARLASRKGMISLRESQSAAGEADGVIDVHGGWPVK
jgi:hypothetical protein